MLNGILSKLIIFGSEPIHVYIWIVTSTVCFATMAVIWINDSFSLRNRTCIYMYRKPGVILFRLRKNRLMAMPLQEQAAENVQVTSFIQLVKHRVPVYKQQTTELLNSRQKRQLFQANKQLTLSTGIQESGELLVRKLPKNVVLKIIVTGITRVVS